LCLAGVVSTRRPTDLASYRLPSDTGSEVFGVVPWVWPVLFFTPDGPGIAPVAWSVLPAPVMPEPEVPVIVLVPLAARLSPAVAAPLIAVVPLVLLFVPFIAPADVDGAVVVAVTAVSVDGVGSARWQPTEIAASARMAIKLRGTDENLLIIALLER
jgi:hypothetical protein